MNRMITHTLGWWHQLRHRITVLGADERGSVTIETVVWAVAVIAIAKNAPVSIPSAARAHSNWWDPIRTGPATHTVIAKSMKPTTRGSVCGALVTESP